MSIGRLRHGHAKTGNHSPTYLSWLSMKARCADLHLRKYGAKGIKVCDRWLVFDNFLTDMGERPPGLTLDRLDSGKDYEPSNCRWATLKEQARQNRRLAWFDGKIMDRNETAAHLGIAYVTLNLWMRKGKIALTEL